jgi:hypothetical protein
MGLTGIIHQSGPEDPGAMLRLIWCRFFGRKDVSSLFALSVCSAAKMTMIGNKGYEGVTKINAGNF